MMTFIEGYFIGIGTILFIGPVFFTLIKTALHKGVKAGLFVVLGIFFSDIFCATICYLGGNFVVNNDQNTFWLSLTGACILLFMGLKYVVFPQTDFEKKSRILNSKDYSMYFSQGFLVNLINPFVFVIWLGMLGIANTRHENMEYLFLASVLLGILSTDILKVLLAHKIKPYINPRYLSKMYKIFGWILIFFSVRLFIYSIYH